MSHVEDRNKLFAESIIKRLGRRHIKGYYCETGPEAVDLLLSLIPDGSQVTWGGSQTIRQLGVPDALRAKGTLDVRDRDLASSRDEALQIYREAFFADYYLSSANAMSEDGVIVNIDGNGNRVAAITFGPKNVIFIVGLNKVCQDADAALKRARSTASPINAARFDVKTACKADGACHNCNAADSICNYIHFLRNSPGGRHQVILVGESLGY